MIQTDSYLSITEKESKNIMGAGSQTYRLRVSS